MDEHIPEVITILIAALALLYAARMLRYEQRKNNLTTIFDFVSDRYLDRNWKSAEAPTIDGDEHPQLRKVRKMAERMCKGDYKGWKKVSGICSGDWGNRVCFEVAIALEEVGMALYSGALPANIVLPLVSDHIVDEWIYCHWWVTGLRKKACIRGDSNKLPYHRRHAEWLALLSAAWMIKNYPDYKNLKRFAKLYGGIDKLQAELQKYSLSDPEVFDRDTHRDIKLALGIRLKSGIWGVRLRRLKMRLGMGTRLAE